MTSAPSVEPCGGVLVNLLADEKRCALLREISFNLPDIALNDRQLCDLEMLATGAFSPLNGFMTRSDYESVLDRMELQCGTPWPLPICLDISETLSRSLEAGQSVALRDPEGFLLAVMNVEDMWPVDRGRESDRLFGTTDRKHPGVARFYDTSGEVYVGGSLEVLSLPLHFDFKQLRLTPHEIRRTYRKLGWNRVIGFQTHNPIQRPQFEMTLQAMRQARANLLILPVAGITRPGDFDHYTRVRCYREMAGHYPPDSFILNLLPLATRMAGPRDDLLQMIVSKNFGCTHFIVGRNHGGRAQNGRQSPQDPGPDSCRLAEAHGEKIGMSVVRLDEFVYLPFEDEYRQISQVPEGVQTISLGSAEVRERIRSGRRIPDWAIFPEVVDELRKAYPPPRRQGFTVFLTGLSGAGKSTIAKVLYSRFLEIGDRPVTLLDGDIVRQNLSSNLSFSKEHRDINVRRIGFVAGEITKNRGIAICAPIAPYAATRREIRTAIEAYGGFIEAHVATPLAECEKRDRKGMYAKAKAGLIKGFTGVDDPYEVPESAEVRIDTTDLTPDEAAQEVLLFLSQKGFI